ncbi:MAG: methyltransferase domain-containing protein [Roseivirga sp.]|nr:methyltransferase domain-containing protein [Roseivirga sp.]
MDKFQMQDEQYLFPYHHIPNVDTKNGQLSIIRRLAWGHEYVCYQTHMKLKIEELNPDSVVEVGCGDGHLIMSLDDKISRKVGVDLSERSILMANAFNNSNVEFICDDASNVDGEFDVVVSPEVLEHIPDEGVSDFFRLLDQKCKPGGKILISVPTTNMKLHEKHYRHYDIELFTKQMKDSGIDCKIETVEYIYHSDWFMKNFIRFSHNNKWSIEFAFMRKYVWNRVWNKLRFSKPNKGHRLVVLLGKA